MGSTAGMILAKMRIPMKKSFVLAFAAIAVIAGCAKEANYENEAPVVNGKRQITINANIAQTKTTADNAGIYSWQADEKIDVVEIGAKGDVTTFTIVDTEAGTFTGSVTNDPAFAITPSGVASDVLEKDGEILYDITFDNITDYVPGTTNALMIAGAPVKDGDNYTFTFRHAAALIKVPVANVPVGTAKVKLTMDKNITGIWESLTTTTPVIEEDTNLGEDNVTLTLKDAISEANTSADFYFPVPVNTYGSFQFELIDGEENTIKGFKKESLSIELEAGDLFITPTITLPEVTYYTKVTSDSELREGGQYLIVYEGDPSHDAVAFDGSRETLDASGNGVAVTISNKTIVSTETLDASSFTISVENGTILSASGAYIGVSSNSNGLKQTDNSETYANAISIDDNEYAVIQAVFEGSTMYLRYNYASGNVNLRFRYYTSGQQPIALYVKDGTGSAVVIKAEAGIYYNEEDAAQSITLGDSFTAPTLQNPNNLDVTYSSSNTDVATVVADGDGEGTVTVLSAGVTTITASFAGNDSYKAGTASYTLTVTDPNVVNYVTLPWSYPEDGNSATSAGLTGIGGVTASGLGSDYADSNAPYQIKFDTTGDYIQIKTDSAIGEVSVAYKMLGGDNTSTLNIKESVDGEEFTEVENLSISGSQNSIGTLTTSNAFNSDSRYVQIYFTKGSNVGIGGISITKLDNTPRFSVESPVEAEVDGGNYTVNITRKNFTGAISVALPDGCDWINAGSVAENQTTLSLTVSSNTGGARTATLTLSGSGVTSQSLVVNQAGNELGSEARPFTVAEALEYISEGGSSSDTKWVSGIISKVETFLSNYHSITYWISADGTESNQLEVYSGKGLNGANFSAISDLAIGDQVTVKGTLTTYNSTPEFAQNSQITDISYTTRYTVNLNAGSNGSLSASATSVGAQGSVTITITPNSGYELDVLTVGGIDVTSSVSSNTYTYTFTMPANDVTVSATFKVKTSSGGTVEFTGTSSGGMTTTAGKQTGTKDDVTIVISNGVTSSDQIRIYKSATITISVPSGKTISSIVSTAKV